MTVKLFHNLKSNKHGMAHVEGASDIRRWHWYHKRFASSLVETWFEVPLRLPPKHPRIIRINTQNKAFYFFNIQTQKTPNKSAESFLPFVYFLLRGKIKALGCLRRSKDITS